jgi:hypothetical protein
LESRIITEYKYPIAFEIPEEYYYKSYRDCIRGKYNEYGEYYDNIRLFREHTIVEKDAIISQSTEGIEIMARKIQSNPKRGKETLNMSDFMRALGHAGKNNYIEETYEFPVLRETVDESAYPNSWECYHCRLLYNKSSDNDNGDILWGKIIYFALLRHVGDPDCACPITLPKEYEKELIHYTYGFDLENNIFLYPNPTPVET